MAISRFLGSFRAFNSPIETLFSMLLVHLLSSMGKMLIFLVILGGLVSVILSMKFLVHGDDITNVSDLIIVEYLQQYRKSRVCKSKKKRLQLQCPFEKNI